MKWIIVAAALLAATAAGPVITGVSPQAVDKIKVSREQYQALLDQCRYSNGPQAQADCQARVKNNYQIGEENHALDCREYASTRVCGTLELSREERACVQREVNEGTSYRRAEVQCYVFS
ncbi:hypothetical protein SAMN05216276_106726 [Streptosporangium subroseum]|uniref:Uncharacterized protein n=1 Tax=Streptosporangium subroseum TaxID=106412 RepID=A0A239NRZ6_9ACTN|nr:hypothetical protein [Streptosporangium subroseum]SNT57636.1 hypothetical protein SAMN05216276_106726 [Streptosporangium subroseum]